MNNIETMKLALEALERTDAEPGSKQWEREAEAMVALRQAIEQAQRQWVELTDDEMLMIYGQDHEGKKYNLGRMVQQALKEKNT